MNEGNQLNTKTIIRDFESLIQDFEEIKSRYLSIRKRVKREKMSRMVRKKGRLTPVVIPESVDGLENELKYLISEGFKFEFDSEDGEIDVDWFYSEEVMRTKDGKWFKIESEEIDDYYVDMKRNNDGTIDFLCSFYNGGTYLEEVLEEGMVKNDL